MHSQENTRNNNKRIISNSIMLYSRMLVTMAISFFTTRELLRVLGAEDFGTISLVSGVVTMFSFIAGTISTASSRFFNIELGKKNYIKLRQLFNLSVYIYLALLVVFLILIETVGLWVFNNKINIPEGTREASAYLFQFSAISFLIGVLNIPYNAIIVSRENMKFIAIESIATVTARLGIVYLLIDNSKANLIIYGALIALVSFIRLSFYIVYTWKKYEETKLMLYWNTIYIKELFIFGAWNTFGALVGLVNGTMINILLNNFFGVAINATRAIATQVSTGISNFTQNFLIATRPQIVQYWGSENREKARNLTMQSSKMAFFLIFIFALPVITKTEDILNIWLKETPPYAVIFTKLILIQLLIDSVSYPLMTLMQAVGKIALYQAVVGTTLLLNLPVSYILLKNGFPPQSIIFSAIAIAIICFFQRLIFISKLAGLKSFNFLKKVILPIFIVALSSSVFVIIANQIEISNKFISLGLLITLSILFTIFCIFNIGLTKNERNLIVLMIKNKIKRR